MPAARNRAMNLPAFPKMSKGISELGRLARELTDEIPMLESSEYDLLQQSNGTASLLTHEVVLKDVVNESWLVERDEDEAIEQIERYHRRQRSLLWALIAMMVAAVAYLTFAHVRPMAAALEASEAQARVLSARAEDFQGLLAVETQKTKTLEEQLAALETDVDKRQQRDLDFYAKSAALSGALKESVSDREARVSERTKDTLVIDVSDRALFQRGQSELTERGKLVLCQSGLSLDDGVEREIVLKSSVVGRKGKKLTKRAEAQWALSGERALSVARFLEEGGCDGKARKLSLTIRDRSR